MASITFNTKEFSGLMREEIVRQVDFATAQTLTNSAFDARRELQRKLPTWLDIKRTFLKTSIVVEKANFRDKRPVAYVGFLERARLVELLEEGGVRRPFSSSQIAIPVGAKTKTGRVTKRNRPRQLLARNDTFIANINGVEGIWQRKKGRGKTRLTLMYALEDRTLYKGKNIRFFDTVDRVVPKSFASRFPKNVSKALKQTIERKKLKGKR